MNTNSQQTQNQGDPPQCDLVMRGAIVSGIVYSPAVLELKDHFRFHQIGGTSSGSIAAAATAAAEYNRAKNGGQQGFSHMKEMSDFLSTGTNLRDLFNASPETQPLMDMLFLYIDFFQPKADSTTMGGNGEQSNAGAAQESLVPGGLQFLLQFIQKVIPALPKQALQFASKLFSLWAQRNSAFQKGQGMGVRVGVFVGLILAGLLAFVILGIVSLIVLTNLFILLAAFLILGVCFGVLGGVLGKWLGGIIAGLLDTYQILTKTVPEKKFYGICTGHSAGEGDLTDWLDTNMDQIAGLKKGEGPLTFGMLRKQQQVKQQVLQIVTSNLSHNQPYILPEGLHNFLFKEEEMLKLFPKHIVEYMKHKPPKNPIVPPKKLPTGFYFLPSGDDLPVVVAVRLSISFPLLLSAIPLYTIGSVALEPEKKGTDVLPQLVPDDLQQNWFSDGGICSNFPIEFFDAWLPSHPTFGINLPSLRKRTDFSALDGKRELTDFNAPTIKYKRRFPTGTSPQEGVKEVYLPRAEDIQDPEWEELKGLVPFLRSIISTGLSYHNTLQTNLPSYRDRVVQVRLNEAEGGLHLNMSDKIIKALESKGQLAGKKLCKEFDFARHWWVRFLVLMSLLVPELEHIDEVLKNPTIRARLDEQFKADSRFPYYRGESWCGEAEQYVNRLLDLLKDWKKIEDANPQKSNIFLQDAPLPEPVLRVTTEI